MGGMSGGGGITGTVTEVAADHYIIKTDGGETYTIHFSANTRIMKQTVRQRGEGGGNPPQPLKSTDIKVGDAVAALAKRMPPPNPWAQWLFCSLILSAPNKFARRRPTSARRG